MTCRSSITSSSADCVRGEARLISSARTTLANTGPGWKTNSLASWWKTETPVTSPGSRSGVNWIRCHGVPSAPARLRASDVFPTPGTSSSSRWPSASRQTRARSTTSALPWMKPLTAVAIRLGRRLELGCAGLRKRSRTRRECLEICHALAHPATRPPRTGASEIGSRSPTPTTSLTASR